MRRLTEWETITDISYLELKPLSSITDEAAIDLAEILGWSRKDLYKRYIVRSHTLGGLLSQIELDFLRSRGYALPWMSISVEQQIKFGWIKLID